MEHDKPKKRFIRITKVMDKTGLSRSTIYARIATGGFPKPISLGGRAVAWVEQEIDAWIMARIEATRMGEPNDLTMDIR